MRGLRLSLGVKEWTLRLALVVAALGIAVAVGCSPTTTYAPAPTPTSPSTPSVTPPPFPTPGFSTASTQVTAVATTGGLPVPFPSVGGISGQVLLPVVSPSPGTIITTTISSTPPTGVPVLASFRQAASARAPFAFDASQITPLFYMTFFANYPVQTSGAPQFTIFLPASYTNITGVVYYLAYYYNGAWQPGYAGPATVSGTAVTLTGSFALDLDSNLTNLGLYALPSTASTPPPAPSPNPTASPSPVPSGSVGIGIN